MLSARRKDLKHLLSNSNSGSSNSNNFQKQLMLELKIIGAGLVSALASSTLHGAATATMAAGSNKAPRPLFTRLAKQIISRTSLAFLGGALTMSLLHFLYQAWVRVRRARSEALWKRHVDFTSIQACVLSTEHLSSLGRIEKRTLFVKPIAEVFGNEYIQARVLEAAQKAAVSSDPMMCIQLSEEDKWHVLNTCTNHISSLFAPYHIFFNEARRTKSYYKSAWYCFTMTCAQNEAAGRWFITPYKPVGGVADVGSLRIRILLVNEQELREIAEGTVEEPDTGMFNPRHEQRWKVCQRFSELFARQLRRVTGSQSADQDWGKNLCGRMSKKKVPSQSRLSENHHPAPEYESEDNSMLRIHIPFPTSKNSGYEPVSNQKNCEDNSQDERACRDVVLFE
mmetsp:Transcript_79198/g.164359  ORF Transcript_79198/g.164359 Transcript_79198/m.164359 type:complete len:396 (+) Transcript_79198:355-1542(+)